MERLFGISNVEVDTAGGGGGNPSEPGQGKHTAVLRGLSHPAEVRDLSMPNTEHHVPQTLEEIERAHIERSLKAHNGTRTHAARELGISRATLIKKVKEYGLDPRSR